MNTFKKVLTGVMAFAFAVFFALLTVFFVNNFREMSVLEAGSEKVEARVVDFYKAQPSVKNTSPMQATSIAYSFEVNGQTYTDSALGDEKAGSLLTVLYAENDPTISIPARVNVSEQKLFSGVAAAFTLFVGIGLVVLIVKALLRNKIE